MNLATLDSQKQHYAGVKDRLYSGNGAPKPSARAIRRLIAIRPQSHRPDYVLPVPAAPKLPMIVLKPAVRQQGRDILIVADQPREPAAEVGRWAQIIIEVCEKHGLKNRELVSHRRSYPVVAARHEAMYRLRNETTMSLPLIGKRLGGFDHATVFHGILVHEAKMRGEHYVRPGHLKAQARRLAAKAAKAASE